MTRTFKWDVSNFDNWACDEYPLGAVALEGGNSEQYITGGWRSFRPVWDKEKCINCLFCWVHCPDSCVLVVDKEMSGINYDHCKGCGVCAKVCPREALTMIDEADALESAVDGAGAAGAADALKSEGV
jgi:pyruvate ferredoxin oxidoreductase delta subunit